MSDITEAVAQDQVAESLVSGPTLGSISQLFESTERDNTPDPNGLFADDYPPGYQPQGSEAEQAEVEEPEQEQEREQNEHGNEQTPEQALQELHYQLNPEIPFQEKASEVIEQYGLNDPDSGNQLAEDMETALQPLGFVSKDGEGIDAEKFQNVMTKAMMLSHANPDPNTPIHPRIANALGVGLHEAFGLSATMPAERRVGLGQTLKEVFGNIEQTASLLHHQGEPVTVETVNQDRNGSRIAVNAIMSWIAGHGVQIPDRIAFPLADKLVEWYLNQTDRILNPQPREEEPEQDDPFDEEAIDIYRTRHGRL